jgi:hypothetical protein
MTSKKEAMTEITLKTSERLLVTYELPGSFYPETESRIVPDLNPEAIAAAAPTNAFAFTVTKQLVADYNGTDKVLESKRVGAAYYYIGGRMMTADEIEQEFPDKGILVANVRCNSDIQTGILCRTGNWREFSSRDVRLGA